jgi:hypothetical protein
MRLEPESATLEDRIYVSPSDLTGEQLEQARQYQF